MVTVGLFEPSNHPFLIPPMTLIALEAADDVIIFTTDENQERAMTLDDNIIEACEWVIKKKDDSFKSFFSHVEQATTELDIIWTITPHGPPEVAQELLAFSPRCPAITFLHASSRFLPPRHKIFSKVFVTNVKSLGQYLPAPVRGRAWNQAGEYLTPHILNNFDCVLPLYPPIAEYVKQNVKPDAIVDWFLYDFYRPEAATDHEHLQITVPGRVNESIRDYDVLFDVLDGVNNARDCLTICLLGRPRGASGERIINRCKHYERRGYSIQYYPSDEWVPAEEFAHQMARTDLIFAPINIRGQRNGRGGYRIKGRTITSGAVADAIHIGRPLVMPEEFTVAPEFEELITTYESRADATALLESWASSTTTRQELQQRAESAAQQFSLEKQAQRFESLCQRTIAASNRGQ